MKLKMLGCGGIILKFQIDNSELEESIQTTYGEDSDVLVRDLVSFLPEKQVSEDVSIALGQLE